MSDLPLYALIGKLGLCHVEAALTANRISISVGPQHCNYISIPRLKTAPLHKLSSVWIKKYLVNYCLTGLIILQRVLIR